MYNDIARHVGMSLEQLEKRARVYERRMSPHSTKKHPKKKKSQSQSPEQPQQGDVQESECNSNASP